MALFAISSPLLFLSWTIFVGTFSTPELITGAGAAIAGGVAICIVARADNSRFRPRLIELLQIVSVPGPLLQDTFTILWVSFRDLMGGRKAASAFRVVRFEAGEPCDGHDTARRVLAVAFTTMTPNVIVLGFNLRQNQLLFHQIEKSAVPGTIKSLGAAG